MKAPAGDGHPLPVWQVMLLERIAKGENPQPLARILADCDGIDPAEYVAFSLRFSPADAVALLALEQALNVRFLASRSARKVLETPNPEPYQITEALDHSTKAAKLLLEVYAHPVPMERMKTEADVSKMSDSDLLAALKARARS